MTFPIPERISASFGKVIFVSRTCDAATVWIGAFRLSTKIAHRTVPNMTKTGYGISVVRILKICL